MCSKVIYSYTPQGCKWEWINTGFWWPTLLCVDVRNRLRALPAPSSTLSLSAPGKKKNPQPENLTITAYSQGCSWSRAVTELPPAESACPCRSEMITHSWAPPPTSSKLASSLLPPLPYRVVALYCEGILNCSLQIRSAQLKSPPLGYVVVSHRCDVATIGALRGTQFPFYKITNISRHTFHFRLGQRKEKNTLGASEQRTRFDALPDQVLSVDGINTVHRYEPRYRISMPWFKQLLVTWDTKAAWAITVQHLAVTQQHQHTAMQCASQSTWPLTESGWASASASGDTAPSDYHQHTVQWGTDSASQLWYTVNVGERHFPGTQYIYAKWILHLLSKNMKTLPSHPLLSWKSKPMGREAARDALTEGHTIQPATEANSRQTGFQLTPCVWQTQIALLLAVLQKATETATLVPLKNHNFSPCSKRFATSNKPWAKIGSWLESY